KPLVTPATARSPESPVDVTCRSTLRFKSKHSEGGALISVSTRMTAIARPPNWHSAASDARTPTFRVFLNRCARRPPAATACQTVLQERASPAGLRCRQDRASRRRRLLAKGFRAVEVHGHPRALRQLDLKRVDVTAAVFGMGVGNELPVH